MFCKHFFFVLVKLITKKSLFRSISNIIRTSCFLPHCLACKILRQRKKWHHSRIRQAIYRLRITQRHTPQYIDMSNVYMSPLSALYYYYSQNRKRNMLKFNVIINNRHLCQPAERTEYINMFSCIRGVAYCNIAFNFLHTLYLRKIMPIPHTHSTFKYTHWTVDGKVCGVQFIISS